jgi:hypothetical protein
MNAIFLQFHFIMEKSKVWKYFSKIKDSSFPSVQCHKCPKRTSMKSSNTSGLMRHLEHIHKISLKTQNETETSTSAGCDIEDNPPPELKKSK